MSFLFDSNTTAEIWTTKSTGVGSKSFNIPNGEANICKYLLFAVLISWLNILPQA